MPVGGGGGGDCIFPMNEGVHGTDGLRSERDEMITLAK